MRTRPETPYQPTQELVAGEIDRGRSYTNWRPQGTPDWLLIYTHKGSGLLRTSSGTLTTRPGDATLYAPGEYHDYSTDPATGRWHLLWCHFNARPAWLPWLLWPVGAHGIKLLRLEKGEVRDSFAGAMQRLVRNFRRAWAHQQDFSANALEEALLWADVVAARSEWARTDARVRRAMDYLVADLRRPFELEKLSRHCGLSVSRLAHLFKDETGVSPQQFFEQQRMTQAGRLLRSTGLRIGEIAAEVGYEDAFYFSNRFRKHSGKSPVEFRKRR